VRPARDHIGPMIVLIMLSAWVWSLGFSFGSFGVAAEPLEESMPLISDEFDAAEEHLRLGVDFFLADELEVAIDEFLEAAHQKPGYADAYHNLGVAFAKTGDLTGAITAWTEAERLDPEALSLGYSLSAMVSYNYGMSLIRDGRLPQAIKEWQAALRIQPNFVEAHYALGLGFLAEQNPAVAIGHFHTVLSLAPDWAQAYAALGQAHYESQEYDLAGTAWLKALALNPGEAGIYANLSLLALQEGNYQEAIEYSRQAVALQPDLVSAHFNLGVGLLVRGESQASVEALEHALALDARLTPARLLLGVAWSRRGDWARAAQSWREALQKDPFGQDTFWLHDNLGIALTLMGQFQDATKEFQWVVEQRPEWAQGWSQLGVTLMSERRWNEAVGALEAAVQLEPNWAHLHFTLGNAYAEQGELALAVQAFQEAVSIAPNFVDALFHLGIVLRAQNQLSAAVDPLRQAAEGGSREAQGLLASMYVNGNGIDRNVPLAMLWWSRSSRGSIPDTITRTAQNQLTQLRRRLHQQSFLSTEQQDVLTGFGLIRQDLANQAPFELPASSSLEDPTLWNRVATPRFVLPWMIERALALDKSAQNILREWYEKGVVEKFPPQHSSLERYWLQVAKEGDRVGCEFIETTMPKEKFHDVRQACQSMNH
jgi:tetratricopeptide (TPR) repeat protein